MQDIFVNGKYDIESEAIQDILNQKADEMGAVHISVTVFC